MEQGGSTGPNRVVGVDSLGSVGRRGFLQRFAYGVVGLGAVGLGGPGAVRAWADGTSDGKTVGSPPKYAEPQVDGGYVYVIACQIGAWEWRLTAVTSQTSEKVAVKPRKGFGAVLLRDLEHVLWIPNQPAAGDDGLYLSELDGANETLFARGFGNDAGSQCRLWWSHDLNRVYGEKQVGAGKQAQWVGFAAPVSWTGGAAKLGDVTYLKPNWRTCSSSADGANSGVLCSDKDDHGVYVLAADGAILAKFGDFSREVYGVPSLDFDGSLVAFAEYPNRPTEPERVLCRLTEGGDPVELATAPNARSGDRNIERVLIADSGAWVVWSQRDSRTSSSVWAARPDGSDKHRVVDKTRGLEAITPDGRYIVYSDGAHSTLFGYATVAEPGRAIVPCGDYAGRMLEPFFGWPGLPG